MKLTARLALSQIKKNRNRSVMTLLGIILTSAMLTAVCGYVESAKATIYNALGYDSDAEYHAVLLAMGAVLGAIIVIASIIVVSNAFRVSAGERIRQFGILKSIGSTKKQIASSVLYEGLFFSIIGIPLGIALGLLVELIGISILTNLLHSMASGGTLNVDTEALLTVPFSAPPLMFVVAAVTSLGTVLVSAWLPARKAAKIPAIDAIRGAGEVKLKRKNVRVSKLTQKIFGFEGTLAAKSLKRSRRNFRATVISLTISIVLLITAGSFNSLINGSVDFMFMSVDATVSASWSSNVIITETEQIKETSFIPLSPSTAESITEKLRERNNAEVFGGGYLNGYETLLPDGTKTSSSLFYIDKENYNKLCKAAGVPVGSSILINRKREKTDDGVRKEYAPYNLSDLKDKPLIFSIQGHEEREIIINGELTGKDIPNEIGMLDFGLMVIVPDCETTLYNWFVKVDDADGYVKYAEQILLDFTPKSNEKIQTTTSCMNISGVMKQIQNMYDTVMLFVYGFVGMLTLIAVTSVISTISTNIRSRAREFAVLESVGMTKTGIKKMLNLESIICSVKSLIYGVPIGILCAFGLYYTMGSYLELPFVFPWIPVIECVAGVFAVTWITMRYSASRLKNGSIVETIRR